MNRRATKSWSIALILSSLLLSNNALSEDCVRETGAPSIDGFNDLVSGVSDAKVQVSSTAPEKKLSSYEIDRLAAEASDVVYNLFKTAEDNTANSSRISPNEIIAPVVHFPPTAALVGTPVGYQIAATWNDNAPGKAKRGIFTALYEPQSAGKPVIFAFKGTVTSDDWKEDLLHQGGNQMQSVFRMLSPHGAHGSTVYKNLLYRLESGQDVLITGHSLGGGLAQATAYLLQRDLDDYRRRENVKGKQPKLGSLQLVTFDALGGQRTLKEFAKVFPKDRALLPVLYKDTRLESEQIDTQIDETAVQSLQARNFTYPGDPVSPIFNHIGPKYIVAKKESTSDVKAAALFYQAARQSGLESLVATTLGSTLIRNKISEAVHDHSIKLIRDAIDSDFKP